MSKSNFREIAELYADYMKVFGYMMPENYMDIIFRPDRFSITMPELRADLDRLRYIPAVE